MTADDPAVGSQSSIAGYAAVAAHQLGEAVALVRGATAVLDGQRGRLGPGGDDAMRAMKAGTDRAQRFVDDLLDLVRASSEPEDDAPRTELAAALEAALAELEPPVARARLEVRHAGLPTVALTRFEAERLFVHLVRTALAAGARSVEATASEGDDGEVVVEVVDDGAPARDAAPPFEPFQRPRGHGPLVGAGVSLLVCRQLVERRGGSIALEQRDGGATAVILRLPSGD